MSTYLVHVDLGGVPVSVMVGQPKPADPDDLPVFVDVAGIDLPVDGGLTRVSAKEAERLISRYGHVSRAAWRSGGRPWCALDWAPSVLPAEHEYTGRVP